MKKIILIVLIFIVLFGGFYFFYMRGGEVLNNETQNNNLPGSSTTQNNKPNSNTTKTTTSKYKKIAGDVFAYSIKDDGVYYVRNDGKIYFLEGSLDPQEISNYGIDNLSEIKISSDNSYLLASYRDNNNYKFPYFDFKKREWTPLPDGIISADISPTSKELIYLLEKSSGNVLYIKDLVKNQTKELAKINLSDVDLKWLDAQRIVFMEKESRNIASRIWLFNLKTKELQLINGNGEKRLLVNWFNNNAFALKFSEKDQKGSLSFINKDLIEISQESLSTLPNKCGYLNDKTMLCGVFKEIPAGVFLPDDYMKKSFYSDDDLYLWNPSTGNKKMIPTGIISQIDITQIRATGTKAYFVNRFDNSLYQINIAEYLSNP